MMLGFFFFILRVLNSYCGQTPSGRVFNDMPYVLLLPYPRICIPFLSLIYPFCLFQSHKYDTTFKR